MPLAPSSFPCPFPRIRADLRALALAGVVALGACGAAPAAAARLVAPAPARCFIKPQPPLDVRLEALDPLKPGRVVRFRLTVVPRILTEEIRVSASPGQAVTWIAGERRSRRAAGRDEAAEFAFSVRVPVSGRHPLHVDVEITAADGTVWHRGAGLGLGPNPRAERARQLGDGRGGRVLEFEAAPATMVRESGR